MQVWLALTNYLFDWGRRIDANLEYPQKPTKTVRFGFAWSDRRAHGASSKPDSSVALFGGFGDRETQHQQSASVSTEMAPNVDKVKPGDHY